MTAILVSFFFALFAESPQLPDSIGIKDTLTLITLSPVLGKTITKEHRYRFHFFPGVENFESASVFSTPSYIYFVRIKRRSDRGPMPDTLIEYSGDFLTRMADISIHFDQLQNGTYVLGTDPSVIRLTTGSPPGDRQQSNTTGSSESPAIKLPGTEPEEKLIPFVPTRGIYTITDEMDVKLHLFSEYDGFTDASLFQLSDSLYALEIFRKKDGVVRKTRSLLTIQEMRQLQNKVFSTITLKNPNAGMDQSGRSIFLGNIYSLSIGLYGWGIPYLVDLEGSAAVGTFLLLSAGSVLIANSATEDIEISESTANLTLFGTGLGFLHGTLFSLIFNEQATNLKPYLALTMVGSGVEGFIAYRIAKNVKLSSSQVDVLATSSALGTLYGFGTSVLMDIHTTKGISTSLLVGSIAGTVLGSTLSKNPQLTVGNLNVMRGSFFLGAYIPLTVLIATEAHSSKTYIGSSMIGGVLGTVIGYRLIQNKNFSAEEGILVMSGVLGGALLGGGIPTIVGARARLSILLSGVGAAAGYSVMYTKYSGTAVQRASTSSMDVTVQTEYMRTMAVNGSSNFPEPIFVPSVKVSLRF